MRPGAGHWLSRACLLFALVIPTFAAANEAEKETAYLDELAEEAARISQRNTEAAARKAAATGTATAVEPTASTDVLPPDLEFPAFEAELQDRFIGSFAFYEKLPESGKQEAYDQYLKDRGIEGIREVIMSRFLNQ